MLAKASAACRNRMTKRSEPSLTIMPTSELQSLSREVDVIDPVPPPNRNAQVSMPAPGPLHARVQLTLQTRHAQKLVHGRAHSGSRPGIVGLFGFTRLLSSIWRAAGADDPYADGWLLALDSRLTEVNIALEALEETFRGRLDAACGLSVSMGGSRSPASTRLDFDNPYAFRAAALLVSFDKVACAVLTARHTGLATRDETSQALHQAGRRLRGVFASLLEFRLTGVTRRDVALDTEAAREAKRQWGELDADVLAGTRRAPHAPRIVSPSSGPGVSSVLTHPDGMRLEG